MSAYLWRVTYARYVAASAAALCLDIGLFLLMLRVGVPPIAASSIGYSAGLVLHWIISSRLVFSGAAARDARQRTQQKGLFIASAMIGLAITSAIVGIGTHFGLDARLAKLGAIAVSFQATWMLRRSVVFA
ncbi:GtrA family protein [Sphingobium subterraneum]|uniref:Putative flippase GtrA n=1 Tax=Sphingobium subterraneum TaxID=627688 RepID=A0A841J1N6_9SPHN|nr:putative flippase GtrA [Sphingobium subterraneum]